MTYPLWPGLSAQSGVLHEVRSRDPQDAAAALGFAVALAARVAGEQDAVVFIERANEAREGALSGRGLSAFGFDPSRALFVRSKTEQDALFAAEEAARAGVPAALLIFRQRTKHLTLAAMRRLHLAAQASGATPILVRTSDGGAPTAAAMRWRIAPSLSERPLFDPKAPGRPRFLATIDKAAAGGQLDALGKSFVVEWRHDQRRFVLAGDGAKNGNAADSGARLPASVCGLLPPANEEAGRRTARAL